MIETAQTLIRSTQRSLDSSGRTAGSKGGLWVTGGFQRVATVQQGRMDELMLGNRLAIFQIDMGQLIKGRDERNSHGRKFPVPVRRGGAIE
jgi:hypothetical protein